MFPFRPPRSHAPGTRRRRGGWLRLPAWVALPLALLGLQAFPAHATGQPPLVVLAAGDLRGEIRPCGCSPEGQMGGLLRRLTYVEQRRQSAATQPLLVDLGNTYPEPSAQGRLKVALIRDLFALQPPDALLPGPNELALGLDALDSRLPYVVSNAVEGSPLSRDRIVALAPPVLVMGYLSPGLVYQGGQSPLRLTPLSPALSDRWRKRIASAAPARSLLLFRGDDAELAALHGLHLFDLIIAGNPSADESRQRVTRSVGGIGIPQVPTKGQGFLRITLQANEAGPTAPVDWLTEAYGDHPAALKAFARYEERVKSLFFARLETRRQQREKTPYAGAAACKTCHAAATAVWEQSRHANALPTLERVGKQFDPECLACHVVGLERGGFLSQDLTPELAGVQCENCHGPGRAHAENPALTKRPAFRPPRPAHGTPAGRERPAHTRPGEPTCRTCHVGSHSPTFDFLIYWPKIRHPNAVQPNR